MTKEKVLMTFTCIKSAAVTHVSGRISGIVLVSNSVYGSVRMAERSKAPDSRVAASFLQRSILVH